MKPEVISYWRDKVITILQWGAGVLVLFAGYAADHSGLFKISLGGERACAGAGLLFMTALYAFFLPFSVSKIHNSFLKQAGNDLTILRKKYAMLIAWALVILATAISLLLVFYKPDSISKIVQ